MIDITVGQEAPDFTLYTEEKNAVQLSSLKGDYNVVLLFFPGAFTGVCTTELNEVNNDLENYGEDTKIFGISTDSPFALNEFKKVNAFAFNLLSDHNAEVCALYNVKYNNDFTDMKLDRIAMRSAFVINKEGFVTYAEVTEHAGVLPNLEKIQEALNAQ